MRMSVTCPYCHFNQGIPWGEGDKGPAIVTCGEGTGTPPKLGCERKFVVSAEWVVEVYVQAIQGEGDVLRGAE